MATKRILKVDLNNENLDSHLLDQLLRRLWVPKGGPKHSKYIYLYIYTVRRVIDFYESLRHDSLAYVRGSLFHKSRRHRTSYTMSR